VVRVTGRSHFHAPPNDGMGSPLLCIGSLPPCALHAQDHCCVEHSACSRNRSHPAETVRSLLNTALDGAEQWCPRGALGEGNYWLHGGSVSGLWWRTRYKRFRSISLQTYSWESSVNREPSNPCRPHLPHQVLDESSHQMLVFLSSSFLS
jgi:hypothetical protein